MMKKLIISLIAIVFYFSQPIFAAGGWQSDGAGGYRGTGNNLGSGWRPDGAGGYYGGGKGDNSTGGGGGSGYIGGVSDAETIAGNASMPDPDGGTMTGREGNGLIVISW